MTREEWREFRVHMRIPVIAFAMLVLLLAVNVVLGIFVPFRFSHVWVIEAAVAASMVMTVLVLSMELFREPPLLHFFAAIGFFWVTILFSMTLLDYLSR